MQRKTVKIYIQEMTISASVPHWLVGGWRLAIPDQMRGDLNCTYHEGAAWYYYSPVLIVLLMRPRLHTYSRVAHTTRRVDERWKKNGVLFSRLVSGLFTFSCVCGMIAGFQNNTQWHAFLFQFSRRFPYIPPRQVCWMWGHHTPYSPHYSNE